MPLNDILRPWIIVADRAIDLRMLKVTLPHAENMNV
jgi:hypothetical protein